MDAQLQDDILASLNRCQFLLNRIRNADWQAFKNSETAIDEAKSLLLRAGYQPMSLHGDEDDNEKEEIDEEKLNRQPRQSLPRQATSEDVMAFVVRCQDLIDKYMASRFPNLDREVLTIRKGSRYFRIFKDHSVYAFIDRLNGDILKPATYKAPAKHARGNIFDADQGMKYMGPYGPAYLR